jgi:hypothetical protein
LCRWLFAGGALVFQMFEIVLRSRCHKQFSGAEVD